MKIAVVSLEQSWEDKEGNRKSILALIQRPIFNDVDLIVFPELTLTGFTMDAGRAGESSKTGATVEFFKSIARLTGAAVIFGMVAKTFMSRFKNTAICISPDGTVAGKYSKMFLFSSSNEQAFYKPGRKPVVVSIAGLRIGLTICYDLRFANLYQKLSRESDLIVNIANWPSIRKTHWLALLQARAIENHLPVIGCNRQGQSPDGQKYEDSSAFFDVNGIQQIPVWRADQIQVFDFDLDQNGKESAWVQSQLDWKPRIPNIRRFEGGKNR